MKLFNQYTGTILHAKRNTFINEINSSLTKLLNEQITFDEFYGLVRKYNTNLAKNNTGKIDLLTTEDT